MKFHIISIVSKIACFSKSALFLSLFLPLALASCKEGEVARNQLSEKEAAAKEAPLEAEIRKMLLTKKHDPKKLVKLVKDKPWKEILASCMKIEKSLKDPPSKKRIVWTRLKIRGSFLDTEKQKNLQELKGELDEMAKEEGRVAPD